MVLACVDFAVWIFIYIYIYIYFILDNSIVTMGEGGFESWKFLMETLGSANWANKALGDFAVWNWSFCFWICGLLYGKWTDFYQVSMLDASFLLLDSFFILEFPLGISVFGGTYFIIRTFFLVETTFV